MIKPQEYRKEKGGNEPVRSPRVARLLEEEPSVLIRYGITIVTAIFLILFIAVALMPWPHGSGETVIRHLLCR